eukprot:TRINITY_DN44002_c0_g1_i1.p1 TRINITY_DN44002_c0_g1~~TRINITY_DN44002_c0_g1_i1.p1  ORF type:complete len:1241 (+),score=293.19 TRINITY_DN44002_c0_g1_i1:78-3800(+)
MGQRPRSDGPGALLWERRLCQVPPQPKCTAIALDRLHARAAVLNLRCIIIVEVESAQDKGKRVLRVAPQVEPAQIEFTAVVWCKSPTHPDFLAASLGCSVIVYDLSQGSGLWSLPTLHLPDVLGERLARPQLDWGGKPAWLVSAGVGADRSGRVVGHAFPADGANSLKGVWDFTFPCCAGDKVPQEVSLSPAWAWGSGGGRKLLALRGKCCVQVWDVGGARPQRRWERDFERPVKAICWSTMSGRRLLILSVQPGGHPTVVEVDGDTGEPDAGAESQQRQPAANVFTALPSTIRMFALPVPFAPLVLAATTEQQMTRLLRFRPGARAPEELRPIRHPPPHPAPRAVTTLYADREDGERAVVILSLRSDGLLAAFEIERRGVSMVELEQVREMQQRWAFASLTRRRRIAEGTHECTFRISVPNSKVPYLDQTHYRSAETPCVFFDLLVTWSDYADAGNASHANPPEVSAKCNCSKEHEISLDQSVLDGMLGNIRKAVLDSFQQGDPWLGRVFSVVDEFLSELGQLQPSQLHMLRPDAQNPRRRAPSPAPSAAASGGAPGRQRRAPDPDVLLLPPSRHEVAAAAGSAPPDELAQPQCRALPRPRRCGAVFGPGGSLLHFRSAPALPAARRGSVPALAASGKVWCFANADPQFTDAWAADPDQRGRGNWDLIGGADGCWRNAASAEPGAQGVWRTLGAVLGAPRGCTATLSRVLRPLLEPVAGRDPLLFAACCCQLLHAAAPALRAAATTLVACTAGAVAAVAAVVYRVCRSPLSPLRVRLPSSAWAATGTPGSGAEPPAAVVWPSRLSAGSPHSELRSRPGPSSSFGAQPKVVPRQPATPPRRRQSGAAVHQRSGSVTFADSITQPLPPPPLAPAAAASALAGGRPADGARGAGAGQHCQRLLPSMRDDVLIFAQLAPALAPALCVLPAQLWTQAYRTVALLADVLLARRQHIRFAEAARCHDTIAALLGTQSPFAHAQRLMSICLSETAGDPRPQQTQAAAGVLSASGSPAGAETLEIGALGCGVCSRAITGFSVICCSCGHAQHLQCWRRWFEHGGCLPVLPAPPAPAGTAAPGASDGAPNQKPTPQQSGVLGSPAVAWAQPHRTAPARGRAQHGLSICSNPSTTHLTGSCLNSPVEHAAPPSAAPPAPIGAPAVSLLSAAGFSAPAPTPPPTSTASPVQAAAAFASLLHSPSGPSFDGSPSFDEMANGAGRREPLLQCPWAGCGCECPRERRRAAAQSG